MQDNILADVLCEFEKLAAIPRQSGSEKTVSDFLLSYLTKLGLTTTQDESNNIIADKPASVGFETAPMIILQSHMDMVCVAKDGFKYNPQVDAIKLCRDDTYLWAEGTSLGADDGIGIAESLYIVKHMQNHGPLRLIITVDEEQGMTGARKLAPEYLKNANYLINCDSENYDELVVGCAGSINIDFSRKLERRRPTLKQAWCIEVKGLLGGHSGERINDGRANAIRILALTLQALSDNSEIEIASFGGGTARNVIPDNAKAIILTSLEENALDEIIQKEQKRLEKIYGQVEKNAKIVFRKATLPDSVISSEESKDILTLLTLIHTGVYAMSSLEQTLVETSANLGVVQVTADEIKVQFFPRSSIKERLYEFGEEAKVLASLTGFSVKLGEITPSWRENKGSKLAKLMESIFYKQNNKPMKIITIHAGLECGWHYAKNPKLDIVSIGVTTIDIHSPSERLVLATVRPQVELVMETIRQIADKSRSL